MQKRFVIPILTLLAVLAAVPAFADDGAIYYSLGNFPVVEPALRRLSWVLGSKDYQSIVLSMITIGIFLAGLINVLSSAASGSAKKFTLTAWLVPGMMGAMLYLAVLGPTASKTDLIVYDEVLNQQSKATITLPTVLTKLLTVSNSLERAVVDAITLTADVSIGDRRVLLANPWPMLKQSVGTKNLDAAATLQNYIEQCVVFDIAAGVSGLNLEELGSTDDLAASLREAGNPSVFMQTRIDADGDALESSEGVSCADGIERILKAYSSTKLREDFKTYCASGGYNSSSICSSTLENLTKMAAPDNTSISEMSGEEFFAWRALSQQLFAGMLSSNVGDIAQIGSRQQVSAGMGAGLAASAWMPAIRGTLLAAILGLIPILVLLLPTPIYARVLQTIGGLFVLYHAHGMIDAWLSTSFADYLAAQSFDLTNTDQGLLAEIAIPNGASTMMSMLGYARTLGFGLATIVAGLVSQAAIFPLAQLGGQLSGVLGGAGNATGALLTPEGRSQAINGIADAGGNLTAAQKLGDQMLDSRMTQNIARETGAAWSMRDAGGPQGFENGLTQAGRWSTGLQVGQGLQTQQLQTEAAAGQIPGMPQGSTPADFNLARGGAGLNMATTNGAMSISRDAAGNTVQSSLQAGHSATIGGTSDAPTRNYLTSNAGVFKTGLDSSIKSHMSRDLSKAHTITERAAHDVQKADSQAYTDTVKFLENVGKSDNFSTSQKQSAAWALNKLKGQKTAFDKTIRSGESAGSNSGNDRGQNVAVNIGGQAGANAGVSTPQGSPAQAGANVSVSGGVNRTESAGSASRTYTADDASKARAWSEVSSSDTTFSDTVSGLRESASTSSDTRMQQLAKEQGLATTKSSTTHDNYSTAAAREESLRTTYGEATTDGSALNIDTSGRFAAAIRATYGSQGEDMLRRANAGQDVPELNKFASGWSTTEANRIRSLAETRMKNNVAERANSQLADGKAAATTPPTNDYRQLVMQQAALHGISPNMKVAKASAFAGKSAASNQVHGPNRLEKAGLENELGQKRQLAVEQSNENKLTHSGDVLPPTEKNEPDW
ncbi:MAG: conjugal transfer protein TraG N-terminal domain-containing protein [Geobacteraceae bacterium]|nr:conjugal transfer protein TraG N-terminal domain-containing protein [Geobacteraceae bacterium]